MNSTHDIRQPNLPPSVKQKATYSKEILTNPLITRKKVGASVDLTGTANKVENVELGLVTGKTDDRAVASTDYSSLLAAISNSGQVIAGDGSGGGGRGAAAEYDSSSGGPGGDGGGDNDILAGTTGNDILLGDGSGGGGGGGDNINLLFFSSFSPAPTSPDT